MRDKDSYLNKLLTPKFKFKFKPTLMSYINEENNRKIDIHKNHILFLKELKIPSQTNILDEIETVNT